MRIWFGPQRSEIDRHQQGIGFVVRPLHSATAATGKRVWGCFGFRVSVSFSKPKPNPKP